MLHDPTPAVTPKPIPAWRALWRLARPFTCLAPALGVLSGSAAALGVQAREQGISWREALARLDQAGSGEDPQRTAAAAVLLGILAAVALNIYSNALNQICDLELDREAKPERPLPSGALTKGTAWALALAALLAGLVWAMGARPPGIPSPEFLYCALLAGLLTTAYSLSPVRLKRFGLAANVSVALARGLLLKVAGWSCLAAAFRPFDPEPWILGGVFFLFTLGAVTTKDFSDAAVDGKYGVRSLPVAWGVRRAARFTAFFLSAPWLLLPALGWVGALHAPLSALTTLGLGLAVYGAWTGWLLLRDPERLGTERNHPAWTHMYVLMMAAQMGLGLAYLL